MTVPEKAMEAATIYALGCGDIAYADIARTLGVSPGTVSKWVRQVDPTLPNRVVAQRGILVPARSGDTTCTICGETGFKGEVGLTHHRTQKHSYEERAADGEWS